MREIVDQAITDEILDGWLNGWHAESTGDIETVVGHFVYGEVNKFWYAVRTDSLGNLTTYEFTGEDEMHYHQDIVNGLIDTMDEEDIKNV